MDVDWAPEEVIEYALSLFENENIPCTIFCTHRSAVLENSNKELFELGIHPNFNPLLSGGGGSAEQVLDDLLKIFPDAKGVRSHSMTQSTPLLGMFAQRGLTYESNYFIPYSENIHPIMLWNGMIRLPYIWEDDIQWMYGKKFDDINIDFNAPGMKIFDFHPVHLFLNTVNEQHYLEAKPHYQNAKELILHRNNGDSVKGAKDALMLIFREIKTHGITPLKLSEVADTFKYSTKSV